MNRKFWEGKKVVITGGAALIGSHLQDLLIANNVKELTIIDNLYTGKVKNLQPSVRFIKGDCREYNDCHDALEGQDILFHLACQHGGRGYVDTHRVACADNLSLDAKVFRVARDVGIQKVVFASSACVYPMFFQSDPRKEVRLSEEMCDWNQPSLADNSYGWAKLMGEMALDTYVEEGFFDGVSARQFTVYGPRMRNNHAIAALIAKTYIQQDPFEIWGNGRQFRNWTYVKDIVEGLALIAENGYVKRGAINLGTEQKFTVDLAAETIWLAMGWKPTSVNYLRDMPTGPANRIANARKAKDLLEWTPKWRFDYALKETISWYKSEYSVEEVRQNLEKSLTDK
jgi:nucleoside-diphosphate-sugar epimerase